MYQRILVPLDGSELAECVLPHVESIAQGCSVPDVVLIQVVERFHRHSLTTMGDDGGYISDEDINPMMTVAPPIRLNATP